MGGRVGRRRGSGRLVRIVVRFAWVGPWVAMAGCAPSSEDGPSRPIVRDSAGVTIVENRAPRWVGGAEWCVGTAVTSIGDVDGAPPYQLYSVLDATRLSDGTVVVGNAGTGELRFFSRDGTFTRSVGSMDGGPGEFRGANALRAVRRIRGDSIFTWDLYAQSASIFAPDGDFVRSYRLEDSTRMLFFLGILDDGSLLMMAYDYRAEGRGEAVAEGLMRERLDLFRFGSDHRLTETRAGVSGGDRFQAAWGREGMITMAPPFARVSTAVTGARHAYLATGDADEIAVFDELAAPVKLIRRLGTTRPLTSDMIEHDRERRIAGDSAIQADEGLSPRARRLLANLPYPDVVPPYGRIMVDARSNVWVQVFRVRDEDAQEWSVFDEEGTWLGQVGVPSGLRVFEIGSDYLLGRVRDGLGVERVVVYALHRDGGCAS